MVSDQFLDNLCLQLVPLALDGLSGMLVFVVVPGEERSAKQSGIFDTAEAIWEIRPVFERLKLCLRKWIIITRMRT